MQSVGQGYVVRRHLPAASGDRWFTVHVPWRYTGDRLVDRFLVLRERSTPYTALLTGCMARRARFTAFGVIARLTARPGWAARRTLRGMKSRDRKPMEEE